MTQFISTDAVTSEHQYRVEQITHNIDAHHHRTDGSATSKRLRRTNRRPSFRPLRGRLV
jgi:hypothetical protein